MQQEHFFGKFFALAEDTAVNTQRKTGLKIGHIWRKI